LRLASDLDKLSEWGKEGVAVVASSLFFNSDMIRNAEFSININMRGPLGRPYLWDYSQVDSRDAFPTYLYECDYVVVADPVQIHMTPAEQTFITIPYEEFINGTTIGAAFTQMPQVYQLDLDVKVYVYQKTREITDKERLDFEAKFPNNIRINAPQNGIR